MAGQETSPGLQALLRDGKLAGSWTLDAGQSEVVLKTRHTWGLLPLTGAFRQFSGSGTVTADGNVTGVFTVVATSVDTNNKRRDEHLRSAAFFDVANHPDLTFTVDGATATDEGARVTGSLTVRDQTRPVSFDARVSSAGSEVTLDAEVPVNRADYGLTWNMLGIASMQSTIVIHAVFTRQ